MSTSYRLAHKRNNKQYKKMTSQVTLSSDALQVFVTFWLRAIIDVLVAICDNIVWHCNKNTFKI